jgi:septal ring factor EnvC (AmiA/AmiB activator)
MKTIIRKSKGIFASTLTFLFCLCVLFSVAEAQTAKRKTRRTARPVAVLTSLSVPQQTEPEIISRAEDNQNENQIVIPQNQLTEPESLENKIDKVGDGIKDLKTRVKSLESSKTNTYDEKQKRLLLNLDILTRAETRSESLRKQLFDMIEKESTVRTRLEQIENESRSEMIDRSVAFVGSLRPEELRDTRRKNMQSEKQNLQNLLTEIQSSRTSLETNLQKSDSLVEKLRFKLEKDIDDALTDEPK